MATNKAWKDAWKNAWKKAETKEVKTKVPAEKAKAEPKEEPKEEKKDVIGQLKGGKQVHQGGFLKFKAVRWPVDKSKLPEDIQKWLTNKGYWTNIYLRSKEELEKKHVDFDMVQKLKDFISKNFI